MGNLSGFNAANVEPSEGRDVLPAGEYRVILTSADIKPTSKGDGKLIKVEMQVLGGQYQNRKIFDNINIENPNAVCQQIGLGTLSALCRAVGILEPNDTSELCNKPLMVKVKVKPAKGDYAEGNEVVKYSAASGSAPVQPVMAAASVASNSWMT